ncbi:hypothetical protein DVK44_05110 [Streptomyces paludis]|uniref:Uncharacterized protein n=1 Tax=Streptomyces paludis TaxID=2282738 RepID=A0A345HKD7_9ACTN|nr:hypothetical protein DVK44_05110 [Streptomyces paludis]
MPPLLSLSGSRDVTAPRSESRGTDNAGGEDLSRPTPTAPHVFVPTSHSCPTAKARRGRLGGDAGSVGIQQGPSSGAVRGRSLMAGSGPIGF